MFADEQGGSDLDAEEIKMDPRLPRIFQLPRLVTQLKPWLISGMGKWPEQ